MNNYFFLRAKLHKAILSQSGLDLATFCIYRHNKFCMFLHSKKPSWQLKLAIASAATIVVYALLMLLLPAPKPVVKLDVSSGNLDTGQTGTLQWPSSGGAAIGAVGLGVVASNNADKPMPTASIAKVILAMAVLRQKP